MRLAHDYELALTGAGGRCRIRLFRPETRRDARRDPPVVVCSMPGHAGTAAREDDPASEAPDALSPERVAAEVMLEHGFGDFIWVSHEVSPREAFYLVVFSHHEVRGIVREDGVWRREIGPPTWKPLDRESVESLVGVPLD